MAPIFRINKMEEIITRFDQEAEALRQSCDKEIATIPALAEQDILAAHNRMHEEVSRLKRQRNGFVLIARLPDDILTRIFMETRNMSQSGEISEAPLLVSQICSAWRSLALGFRRLWTQIDCARPRWAELMQSRASECPLSVTFNEKSYEYTWDKRSDVQDCLKCIANALPRASTLHLSGNFKDIGSLRCLNDSLGTPLPQLEKVTWKNDIDFELPSNEQRHLLEYPREITLRNFTLDVPNIVLSPRLTKLNLAWNVLAANFKDPDALSFITLLSSLSSLEHIKLECVGSRNSAPHGSHVPSDLRKVTLKNLRILEVSHCKDAWIATLLAAISLPSKRLLIQNIKLISERCLRAIVERLSDFRLLQIGAGCPMDGLWVNLRWDIMIGAISQPEDSFPLRFSAAPARGDDRPHHTILCEGLAFHEMKAMLHHSVSWESYKTHARCFHPFLSACTTFCIRLGVFNAEIDSEDRFFAWLQSELRSHLPALENLILYRLNLTNLPEASDRPHGLSVTKIADDISELRTLIEQLVLVEFSANDPEPINALEYLFPSFSVWFAEQFEPALAPYDMRIDNVSDEIVVGMRRVVAKYASDGDPASP